MALTDLAKFNTKDPVTLRDISLGQGISLVYLEQLFLKLKKNKIVKSIRGNKGGYVLNKNASEVKISDIFTAVDEKIKQSDVTNIQRKVVMEDYQNVSHMIYGMSLKIILMIFSKRKI